MDYETITPEDTICSIGLISYYELGAWVGVGRGGIEVSRNC